ncbi:MAG: hypothetical protein MUE49_05145 [Rhodospirillales bacterium]|jgi:hypothetical protein|nr:hypothetical protein [Rhodospirillales bacterium]
MVGNRLPAPLRCLAVAGVLMVLAAQATAAAAEALPPSERQQLARLLGSGVIGPAVPSAPLGDPDLLLPLRPATWTFLVASGPGTGILEIDSLQPAAEADGTWRYTAGHRTTYAMLSAPDGSLTVASEEELGAGVVTDYEPPRPLLLTGAAVGVPQTRSLAVSVYSTGEFRTPLHTGSLTLTYTYLGRHQVTVPAGRFTAALIRLAYDGTIGPAAVRDTEYWLLADGVGPVAVAGKQTLSALLGRDDGAKSGKVLTQASP